jgi:hypothetical protein
VEGADEHEGVRLAAAVAQFAEEFEGVFAVGERLPGVASPTVETAEAL